jgi:hypothetical protein
MCGEILYAYQATNDCSGSVEDTYAAVYMLITAGMLMQAEWHFNG